MSFQLKQSISMAILATLVTTSAAAQVVDPQTPVPQQPVAAQPMTDTTPMTPVTFGIKGGVNYSNLKLEDDSLPVTWLLGGGGGLFMGGNLTPNIGMKVEALYNQRGAKDDLDGADAKVRLSYIDVPVTFHVGTSMNNGARLFLFTGPQVGYSVKAEIINDLDDTTTDNDDAIRDWEFAWTVGAGVAMNRVSLDARYTHGLTNINDLEGPTVKNQTISVMVGIRLR